MLHLGDITKISGYTAPITDCVVGGSPCQDLSIAGKRAGLDGERSGLFMEQIRIIKEMRDRDVRENGRTDIDVRPRYMVWENVPGAFSSNKGEDFRIVLEETARVKDKDAHVPMPDNGKWQTSGCLLGNGWSIAWRVLDAQFWGVPQRRRRIALVADFGGHSAPEILFVRKGVSGYSKPSESERKATAQDVTRGIGTDDSLGADQYNGVILGDSVSTLGVNCGMSHGRQCVLDPMSTAYTMKIRSGCDVDANGKSAGKGALIQTEKSGTLSCVQDQYLFQPVVALDRASYNQGKNAQFDIGIDEKGTAQSLVAKGPGAVCYSCDEKMGNGVAVMTMQAIGEYKQSEVCSSLKQRDYKDATDLVCAVDCRNGTEDEMNGALQSMASNNINSNNVVRTRYTVRRLTPLECERLQGYPDNWTLIGEPTERVVQEFDEDTGEKEGEHIEQDFYYTNSQGKRVKASDAVRYKALGNSIALPPWKWVMKRLCACYERDATLASLFDGIGGFPYIWEQINGKGSCLWASEIEDFPIAVTKVRIGE